MGMNFGCEGTLWKLSRAIIVPEEMKGLPEGERKAVLENVASSSVKWLLRVI